MTPSPSPCHNPVGLQNPRSIPQLNARIVACRRCPRLVAHREAVAAAPPRRYLGQRYWARPLPGFGDPRARLLLVGLAPAAHGGNRTGRMFTGDGSAAWLARGLFQAGFATQPVSERRGDGLALVDAYMSAAIRCAPPKNKPTPRQLARCADHMRAEFALLQQIDVVLGLGKIGFDTAVARLAEAGFTMPRPRPRFGHGVCYALARERDG